MDGRTDRMTDRQIGWTDGRTDRTMDRQIGWMDGRTDGQNDKTGILDGWTDKQTE